ncbi:MAG: hypothetical protein ING75_03860 [Rhodocyclaceae bacterium]|nr:hypothetical protein [Rhodocyclaceae bacterium]
MSKQDFYRQCYQVTGWVPAQSLTQRFSIGEICQIRNGRLQPLLNIGDAHLVENLMLSHEIPLHQNDWQLSQGAHQVLSEKIEDKIATGSQDVWTRQVIEFSGKQDFVFHALAPKARLLLNWNQIRDDLTLKLTQLHYSFRHVYVVTAVASAVEWGLAVAGEAGARLEMSSAVSDCNYFRLLSHPSAQSDRCTGMASFEVSRGEPAHFIQAKKLVMSDAMSDRYLQRVVENTEELSHEEVANWLQTDFFDQIRANELNLTTSMGFFSWVDVSLDDVELLTA